MAVLGWRAVSHQQGTPVCQQMYQFIIDRWIYAISKHGIITQPPDAFTITSLPAPDHYRGISLKRNKPSLGSYSRTMTRALWKSWGAGRFLMSEVPLYARKCINRSLIGASMLVLHTELSRKRKHANVFHHLHAFQRMNRSLINSCIDYNSHINSTTNSYMNYIDSYLRMYGHIIISYVLPANENYYTDAFSIASMPDLITKGAPHSWETAFPWDPAVGLCPGPYGVPGLLGVTCEHSTPVSSPG